MRWLALALAGLIALPALADGPRTQSGLALTAPTAPVATNNNQIATTAWVNNLIASGLTLASGKIWIGSAGNIATPQTPSGDCTLSLSGVITCTQSAGNFQVIGNLTVGGSIIDGNGVLMTNIAAPATPAAGTTRVYVDSTTKVLTFKNDAGAVGNAVIPSTCSANQFGTSISAAGVFGCTQPAITNISGFGTGVATALGVNVGTAGAPVVNGGAGGTPSSITLTNGTGLPTTGLTGALQAAQEPAHTGDVTNSAGSLALTLSAGNAGNLNSGTLLAARMPALIGDCTTSAGAVATTCTKINGVDQTTAWTTFVPALSCGTATFTVNSARFKTMGKTVWISIDFIIATIGTCTNNFQFTLPSTPQSGGGLAGRESAVNGKNIGITIPPGSTTATGSKADISQILVNERFQASGVYESQ